MTLSTYAELKSAVADFLNRDDLTNTTGTFITLAEAQMQREIRHWQMEAIATITTTGQYTALPADFMKMRRARMTSNETALIAVQEQRMQDMRLDGATGDPCYYSITAGQMEIYPTPTGDVEILYLQRIPALSDSNTSNWLLAAAPDVYLYGALLQSSPYLQDDERLPVWSSLYAGAISALNIASDDAKYGDGGLTVDLDAGV